MRHRKHSFTLPTGICICICTCAVLLPASCSQDGVPGNGTELPAGGTAALRITSASLQAPQEQPGTRAAAADLLTSGSIGVFRSQGTGYTESQDNRQYTYNTAAGAWQPQAADQTVYLMANDAGVCAYYPYNSAYVNRTAIPLAPGKYKGVADDAAHHDPADLCYATERRMNGKDPATGFEMNHAMAMVEIKIFRMDDGAPTLRLTSLGISNDALASTATLDITTGAYAVTGKGPLAWIPGTPEPATGIDLPYGDHSEATSALLVPCTPGAAGTTFSFTVDRKSMSVTVPVSKLPAFQAGKVHRLIFYFTGAGMNLESVSITGWWREWFAGREPGIEGGGRDYVELAGTKWALSNLEYDAAHHTYNFGRSTGNPGSALPWNALTDTEAGNATATWDAAADPCSRVEPKGTWMSPTKEQFVALAALPNLSQPFEGEPGRWFGTTDPAEAGHHSGRHLFLHEGDYWTRSYNSAAGKPVAYSVNPLGPKDTAHTAACRVRCVRKPL